MTVDVYRQFFSARATCGGVERRAALVALTADSSEGVLTYEVLVTFFPHRDEEDYAVSYDACASRRLFRRWTRPIKPASWWASSPCASCFLPSPRTGWT